MNYHAFTIIVVALALPLTGCESSKKATSTGVSGAKIVYGLSDDELNYLGARLAFRVEALGMSCYVCKGRDFELSVVALNDVSVQNRVQAAAPVVVSYAPSPRRPPLEMRISISHGVTLASVEEQLRAFLIRAEATKQ